MGQVHCFSAFLKHAWLHNWYRKLITSVIQEKMCELNRQSLLYICILERKILPVYCHSHLIRSSRGVEKKKQNVHPFVVASFNVLSENGNDMACKRCKISTFMKDNGVNLFL